ncbi:MULTISPECIES: response regulator [Oceanotoga]|jgi:DNA-binding NtrC family response regulator|uniref:Response regulator receiver domain-containing protein n=1 Tax=Oceanotoga teriensis TaxID=515440 RepID=A0AA45C4J8_9BACT|nr:MULTISPECIES: response regulator [Oceanotoga]MDN5343575.1 hypothetical protein [Oceanotoga sp.]MDO7977304.1 response regulator [Oceanotoga teriensis]PWJ86723.1 response regulator receiver domain-containing protein [Oceanotoga teriensis]
MNKIEIIIIEEEESVINLYKKLLQNIIEIDFDIKTLSEISEIDNFLENYDPEEKERLSLIISEIEINGKDITEKLEKIKSLFPKTHLYIISNFVTIDRLKKSLKFGVDDWHEKPVTPEEFYGMVKSSIFKYRSLKENYDYLSDLIDELDIENHIQYYSIKNKISKLMYENPNSYQPHLLFYKFYRKKGKDELAQKHYKASNALK